jgi:hypothetical protein
LAAAIPAALESGDKLPAGQRRLIQNAIGEAQGRDAAGGSLLLSMALINGYAAAAFTEQGESLLPEHEDLAKIWPDEIAYVLARAPHRLDILPTYLNWLLVKQRPDDLRAMLIKAARLDEAHPVVLWFSGILLIGSSDAAQKREGLLLMRNALAAGIERFMPVDNSIKAALKPGPAAK